MLDNTLQYVTIAHMEAQGTRTGRRTMAQEWKHAPSIETLERWMADGIAEATDGCRVEPDGYCEHSCPSWLLELGLI